MVELFFGAGDILARNGCALELSALAETSNLANSSSTLRFIHQVPYAVEDIAVSMQSQNQVVDEWSSPETMEATFFMAVPMRLKLKIGLKVQGHFENE